MFTTRRVRVGFVLVIALTLGVCALDASRPPAAQWSTRAALALVHQYQQIASPVMPTFGVRCRFTPTCSRYAEAVLRAHGVPRGIWLTLARLARCGPWTKDGTVDPAR